MQTFRGKLMVLVAALLVAAGIAGGAFLHRSSLASQLAASGGISFSYVVVDPTRAGDIKLVGDMDGDGRQDLVIGGMPNEGLVWYENPSWASHLIAAPVTEFTTDGALGDVDGDGDLDIVIGDGDGENNLLWFENPRPARPATDQSAWQRRVVGSVGSWVKDVELADFDGDGRLDVAARRDSAAHIFFQTAANSWSRQSFVNPDLGAEGMASGDVDGDSRIDLVLHGVWLRNPGADVRNLASWQQFTIGDASNDFKALVADVNGDGKADVLFSSSEGTADVVWYTPTTGDPSGGWTRHLIVANLERAHTLQVADMDGDGDADVVVAQMHTSTAKEISVYLNLDGQATSWAKQVIAGEGLHNGVVADIDGDGDPDLFGANWTGNPPVRLWLNQPSAWTYTQISASNERSFGLGFGDVDADGSLDVVAGLFWYRNPGADLLGDWAQAPLPAGMHGSLVLDVDGDAAADIIAQKNEGDVGLHWVERQADGSWLTHPVGTLPKTSHDIGTQGYRVGQIVAGGQPEIAFSSGQGVFYFEIPTDPQAVPWPRTQVSANLSDEGFALGDIDRDGDLDVAATTGDAKGVEWYENPGDGSEGWNVVQIGTFPEAVYPDRTELADFDGDGRLDVLVTEENGEASGAETRWWSQPEDLASGTWERRLVVTQGSTNSADVADIDCDGDIDLVLAEHRGALRLAVWLNDGAGNFTEQLIDQGKESHLGARTIDLDGDGDLDLVSMAYDDFGKVHLWRNNRPPSTKPSTPTAEPSTPTAEPSTPGSCKSYWGYLPLLG